MSFREAVQRLQLAPLAERLQAIELLLQSLKGEINRSKSVNEVSKRFHIRTFSLGRDVQVDRDEMYTDRVL